MKVNINRSTPVHLPTPEADRLARELHQMIVNAENAGQLDLGILKKTVVRIMHSKDPEGTKIRNLRNVYTVLSSRDTVLQARLMNQLPKEDFNGSNVLELLRDARTLDSNPTVQKH